MIPEVEVDTIIVGAGVVGLAVAKALLEENPKQVLIIVDRHSGFGQEASSRNSEVIHAGFYYKGYPLKESLCIEGKHLLYEFCRDFDVPARACGKWVLASDEIQSSKLSSYFVYAQELGIPVRWFDKRQLEQVRADGTALPNNIVAGFFSSTSGIVDSHSLMKRLEAWILGAGGNLMYRHSFVGLDRESESGVGCRVLGPDGNEFIVKSNKFINCAGLAAARVSNEFGLDKGYQIKPCRGRYFQLSPRFRNRYQSLVYPLPDPRGGLGVHLTIDLAGQARLGPDVDWSASDSLEPDDASLNNFGEADFGMRNFFLQEGTKILPDLDIEDLSPGYVGVRAKLFVDGQPHSDFCLASKEKGRDLHLLGIESPGLTSALALGRLVVASMT